MSFEIEETLLTKDSSISARKKVNLSEKLFSIDNLLNKESNKRDAQNASELGMSTLGGSDNENDCEDEISGKDEGKG